MRIKKALDKIPGGLMVVPLFLGAALNTFFPHFSKDLGSFTFGLTNGAVPILAIWFVCLGASIQLKSTKIVLKKSGTLLITKVATAWIVAFLFSRFIPGGYISSGFFAGLSTLALVAAMDMTNTGLYASLMQQYGTKEEAGAFVLMNLESGPLMTMIILGTTGIATFDPIVLIGLILPFLIGYILGNLDADMRDFLSKAINPIIPFFAFALGNGINLHVILESGILGILMALFVIIVTGIPLMLADIFIGSGNGTAGIGASSTAGAAVATPMLVAALVPEFKAIESQATALVASSLVITAIIVPIITSLYAKNIVKFTYFKKHLNDIKRA